MQTGLPSRRQVIIEAAVACFIKKGFHQTSMRDVANEAGVSLGNLYNYFSGKSELVGAIAVLEQVWIEQFLEQLTAPKTAPLALILNFSSAYFTQCCQHENVALTAEIIAECLRNPDVAPDFVANRQRLSSTLAEVLEKGVALGELRSDLPMELLPEMILDIIEGMAVRLALFNGMAQADAAQGLTSTLSTLLAVCR